jgi:hypothetical protein
MNEPKRPGGRRTANAAPFSTQLDPALNEEFNARVAAERRTKRAVLEAALRHYMNTVPLDMHTTAAASKPAGRLRKAKGE